MTTQVRILMCVSKENITDGASVYMWHEGSHSSDVAILVREQLEWGKGGQDYDFFFGWVGITIVVSTFTTIVCFGEV